jgi:hypothetical protein
MALVRACLRASKSDHSCAKILATDDRRLQMTDYILATDRMTDGAITITNMTDDR